MKKKLFFACACATAMFMLAGCGEQKKYDEALNLMQQENYDSAKAIFESIVEFEDSAAKIEEIDTIKAYLRAKTLFENADYDGAIVAFTELGDYEDSQDYIKLSERFIAIAKANELLENGKYEEAIEAFTELSIDDMVTEATYQYATKLSTDGNESEAYYQYAKIIGYKNSLDLLDAMRKDKEKLADLFTDDYGTEFSFNGSSIYNDEYGMSLGFFRDDLVTSDAKDYIFSDTMEQEWKKIAKNIKLVCDGTDIYDATVESGIPYCDVKGETGVEKKWYCWYHFTLDQAKYDSYDTVVFTYDGKAVYKDKGIFSKGAKEDEREEVYSKALAYFDNGEYFLAKQQFERLYNYEKSDAYVEVLDTYFDLLLYKRLKNDNKAQASEEKLNKLLADNEIDFSF